MAGVRSVAHYHMQQPPAEISPRGIHWRLLRWAMSLADAVVVLDKRSEACVRAALPDKHVTILPTMVEMDVIDELSRQSPPPASDDVVKLVFVGFVVPVKGVRELVQACLKLPNHRVVLDMVGEVPDPAIQARVGIAGSPGRQGRLASFPRGGRPRRGVAADPGGRHAPLAQPCRKRAGGGPRGHGLRQAGGGQLHRRHSRDARHRRAATVRPMRAATRRGCADGGDCSTAGKQRIAKRIRKTRTAASCGKVFRPRRLFAIVGVVAVRKPDYNASLPRRRRMPELPTKKMPFWKDSLLLAAELAARNVYWRVPWLRAWVKRRRDRRRPPHAAWIARNSRAVSSAASA